MRLFKENGVEKVAATMRDPDPAIVVLKTDGTEVFIINIKIDKTFILTDAVPTCGEIFPT